MSDSRLQAFYKRKLHESQYAYAAKILESQVYCGVRAIKAVGVAPAIFILKNDKQVITFGSQRCKSPWSCPVCSAKKMSDAASKIATAIDALESQGQVAFMITFSIPHLMKYTCKEVYEALANTWLRFVHHANGKGKRTQGDAFSEFVKAIQCEHRIRVGEFTWGKNGWHPHFHCLFFCPKDKLRDVAKWQDRLTERWLYLAKMMTKRALQKYGNYTKDEAYQEVERLYKNISEKDEGAFISKDANGNAARARSSQYICGWGADRELTGNIRKKATAEGHYTPHQLLEIAFEFDKLNNREESDKYMRIYLDYALATFKKYRMRLSPKINAIIKEWRKTHEYIKSLKKKVIERQETVGRWELVCWFKPEQWLQICLSSSNLIPTILELAREINGKELITQLLLKHEIDITRNGHHHLEEFLLSKVFNKAA